MSKYGYGEDQLFFSKMSKSGEVIKWNQNPVYEVLQKKRENLMWFIDRNFKYSLSGVLIDNELHNYIVAYILNILKAVFNLMLAFLYLLLTPIGKVNYFYKSFACFIRFLGRTINIIKF